MGNSSFILNVSTGGMDIVPGLGSNVNGLRWDGEGIRYIRQSGGTSAAGIIHNVTTGTITTIPFSAYFDIGWWTAIRWSPGGNRFALWRCRCIRPAPDENCTLMGLGLFVLDLGSRSADLAACVKTATFRDDSMGDIAFSPDGSRVAFICDGYLRMSELAHGGGLQEVRR
jgi:hypothetical protein